MIAALSVQYVKDKQIPLCTEKIGKDIRLTVIGTTA